MDIEYAGEALIRPGQVLTDRSALSAVARWTQAVSEGDGVCVIHLSRGVDVCEIACDLRDRGFRASPNHVVAGQPLFFGGPASRPFPVRPAPSRPARGRSPVLVGLLDTGVAKHPWWESSDWYGDLGRDDGDAAEGAQAGHGTFLAGLILRRAPGVSLCVRRVLDGDGVGDEATVIRALNRMRERAPQVVNLSFGCYTFDDRPPPLLADALRGLPDTVKVACAGNTADDRPFWPAALQGVIAVGAVDAAEQRPAPFTAHGTWVDACARGEWLTSSYLETAEFEGYAAWSGTSFAAALVAGAIADAARDRPAQEAAMRVLDPARARQIPDLGSLVPSSL
ncbi:S8/S53 family peptidase [Nonomuraea sp. SMC257]|uniref:S8/S53 family peptidase n=1 Tax=Nonomuraea montanisoli TaxID=2741721 RepID=A0A7Y6I3Z9_9ACTN|nr:S8/S53 family peptidase [Nonomuraea montanisoli]NUW30713.1 S8/S53 family peptidase [Nonomuraea montanisoli]